MSKVAAKVFVGLGSNLGDRAATLRRAAEALREAPGISDVRLSPIYETAPEGFVNQPAFLNAVTSFRTTLGPIQLFLLLKNIENRIGRTPTFRWGPREIDLDLLLYGDQTVQRRGLSVPHPRLYERAFVLVPLRDLWPEHRDPLDRGIDQVLCSLTRLGGSSTLAPKVFDPGDE